MRVKTKLWTLAIVGLVLAMAILFGIKGSQIFAMIQAGKSFVPPPESVATAKAQQTMWESSKSAVASLVAARGVTLTAELPGRVQSISFESGGSVKKGAVLVQLDASTELAQLASAIADASLARTTLEREQALRAQGSTTQSALDAAQARAKQANAAVAGLRATIAKKTIRAPFDGRISIRQVELGQVLAPGDPIASLQSVTPIHADFWLPQQSLAELSLEQRVRLSTDAFPDATWTGTVTAINPQVDQATRNVRVRATFDNEDGKLRPGMFAQVDVISSQERAVLMIPATSVIYAPYGDSVFVLEDKSGEKDGSTHIAHQRFVRVGERRGDFVAVTSGLHADETVVSSGAFKLRNGASVVVNNALAFGPELSPKPTDQ